MDFPLHFMCMFLGWGRELGSQHKHKKNMAAVYRKTLGPEAQSHNLLAVRRQCSPLHQPNTHPFILLWRSFPFLSLHSFPDGFPGKYQGDTVFPQCCFDFGGPWSKSYSQCIQSVRMWVHQEHMQVFVARVWHCMGEAEVCDTSRSPPFLQSPFLNELNSRNDTW